MKYKGLNKYYFGIGFKKDAARWAWYRIFFYFFKYIKDPERGEMMQRKIHYKGFILEKYLNLDLRDRAIEL